MAFPLQRGALALRLSSSNNGDGTLTATVDYGGVEPLFENVYGAEAVDAALTGTKKLQAAEGLTPVDITGKFTFTVTADEAGAPMPERTTQPTTRLATWALARSTLRSRTSTALWA